MDVVKSMSNTSYTVFLYPQKLSDACSSWNTNSYNQVIEEHPSFFRITSLFLNTLGVRLSNFLPITTINKTSFKSRLISILNSQPVQYSFGHFRACLLLCLLYLRSLSFHSVFFDALSPRSGIAHASTLEPSKNADERDFFLKTPTLSPKVLQVIEWLKNLKIDMDCPSLMLVSALPLDLVRSVYQIGNTVSSWWSAS